ncbi:MAG: sigma factor [bacterium]
MQDQLDSLESYMSAIKGVQHLTPAEEKTLAAAMMNGDVTAAHKVIKSHLLWVVKIAHKYKGFGLTLQELISAGNAGLLHATEMFDPSKGARLSTYSKWWVKEFIQKALENESSTIRVPAEMSERLSQIEATRT